LELRSVTSDTAAPAEPRGQKRPAISFEFFPPKTEEMERGLWEVINRLAPHAEFRVRDLRRGRIDP
jgi:methylenetetrahydrofolate reductase (NADPH)